MRKSKRRLFLSLLAVMLCMAAFPMTALASGGDYYSSELPIETPEATEQPAQDEPWEETTGGLDEPFTPDGNLSLIDDFSETVVDADGNAVGKQFITVQSKAGNYFYIVIDRAGDKENVYFLNLVDEADLLALIDEPEETEETVPPVCTCEDKCYAGHVDTSCPVCAVNVSGCTGKEVKPAPTVTPEEQAEETKPEKKSLGKPVLAIVLLLALGGGAAYYFLKVKGKPKPKTKGSTDLDEYDFGDGDEYELEPYNQEKEDAGDDGV